MNLQKEFESIKNTILKKYPNVKGNYLITKDIKLIKQKDLKDEQVISTIDLIKLFPKDSNLFLSWLKMNNKEVFKIIKK